MGRYSDIDGESVERFLDQLSDAYPEAPTGEFDAAHVVAMMEASRGLSPDRRVVGMFDKAMMSVRTALKPMWAKVVAATTALLLAFSGVAIAGVLPTPAQDSVARAVAGLGIDLPDSQEAEDADETTEDAEEATEADDDADDADDTGTAAESADDSDDEADDAVEPGGTDDSPDEADEAETDD